MLDPKLLRNEAENIAKALRNRGFKLDIGKLKSFETSRKDLQIRTQGLQNQRNSKSKSIGKAKASGENIQPLLDEVASLGDKLKIAENLLSELQHKITAYSLGIPNIPHETVPVGNNEEHNQEIRRWGEPRTFHFKPKDHIDLGKALDGIDIETAAKISGSRFTLLYSDVARLHRALIQFMLDTHINKHAYVETYVPYLVNSDSLQSTGQLPKFKKDLFKIEDNFGYYLIPTAEVPITNIIRDVILEEDDMPRKWVSHTPCFRSEAGSYGKDTRGMIRQHQFEKVEMVQAVRPHESWNSLEELTGHAEAILQELELPYRVVTLCTGDMGFSAAKTYDLEVWLPGQQRYREISSCSHFTDFQARRLQARWRNPETGKPELLHTINGSGLAVGRALVAVMENYQNVDGSITIPEALRNYMGGRDVITAQT